GGPGPPEAAVRGDGRPGRRQLDGPGRAAATGRQQGPESSRTPGPGPALSSRPATLQFSRGQEVPGGSQAGPAGHAAGADRSASQLGNSARSASRASGLWTSLLSLTTNNSKLLDLHTGRELSLAPGRRVLLYPSEAAHRGATLLERRTMPRQVLL